MPVRTPIHHCPATSSNTAATMMGRTIDELVIGVPPTLHSSRPAIAVQIATARNNTAQVTSTREITAGILAEVGRVPVRRASIHRATSDTIHPAPIASGGRNGYA